MRDDREFGYHWLRKVGPALGMTLSAAGLLALAVICLQGDLPWPVLLVPVIFLAWTGGHWLAVKSFKLTIDRDGRLWCHRGVLGSDSCTPLLFARTEFRQPLLGRILGYGTLILQGSPEQRFEWLERFGEILRIIEEGRPEEPPRPAWPGGAPILVFMPLIQQRHYHPPAAAHPRMIVEGEPRGTRAWHVVEEPWAEEDWPMDLSGVPILDEDPYARG